MERIKNTKNKENKSGFTLIELLAVIIILGVLLLVAIPSISKYITQSKINTYESNLLKLVDAVRTEVNTYSGEYSFNNNQYLIVPLTCIDLEKGNNQKSPFGSYIPQNSFIAVTRKNNATGFNYYVSALDDNNYGVGLIEANSKDFKVVTNPKPVTISERTPNTNPKTWELTGEISTEFSLETINKTGKMVTCDTFVPEYSTLSEEILKDNVAQADTDINFVEIGSAINANGLYYTSTNTEDNKTTYYFSGVVDNNYVLFADAGTCSYKGQIVRYMDEATGELTNPTEEQCTNYNVCFIPGVGNIAGWEERDCNSYVGGASLAKGEYKPGKILWRIVRINEDGSTRLITDNLVGFSAFNTNSDDNAYVGYMYGTLDSDTYEETHMNTNSSTIKTYLDTWYANNLSSYSSYFADAGFCNDRTIASDNTALGYAKNDTAYGFLNRFLTEEQPRFACPNEGRDLFTTSSATKGNKALTHPIGLLTIDEVYYAGGRINQTNTGMYLTNVFPYLTMSPFELRDSIANVWSVLSDGSVNGNSESMLGVRPVVNLKSKVEIIGGDGTLVNPYIIK